MSNKIEPQSENIKKNMLLNEGVETHRNKIINFEKKKFRF